MVLNCNKVALETFNDFDVINEESIKKMKK